MLGFETLTFAPIDARLIDAEHAVDSEELAWLNAIMRRCWRGSGRRSPAQTSRGCRRPAPPSVDLCRLFP